MKNLLVVKSKKKTFCLTTRAALVTYKKRIHNESGRTFLPVCQVFYGNFSKKLKKFGLHLTLR